jgi:hypothetical protein
MNLIAAGERRNKRHWSRRVEARGQSQPAVDDSRRSTPAGCDADAVLDDLYARY